MHYLAHVLIFASKRIANVMIKVYDGGDMLTRGLLFFLCVGWK